MTRLPIYLEIAPKRTFAGAVQWPGGERGGRDEAAAIEAYLAAAPRYAAALGAVAAGFRVPRTIAALEVVERHEGGSGTEFGVPSRGPLTDDDPLDERELERLSAIVRAAWAAFDAAAARAAGTELRKGPRGGGRDVDRIVAHVHEADEAYLREIGGRPRDLPREPAERALAVRDAALAALIDRAHGVEAEMGRRTRPWWSPRYYARRAAWHALDHAWEIEDRSSPAS